MTTPPPEASTPLIAPTPEETRAINNAYSDEEIRNLAQQLLKSGELGFDPSTILKGVVTEIDFFGSPPTLAIQISGDTTTTITNVVVMNNYAPEVGHTVLVAKQGADIFALGHIAEFSAASVTSGAGGWVRASLANGSHNGNSNGDIYYRRVLDHGSWKMEWRGGWNPSGNTVMVTGLPEEYRPTSGIRSITCARNLSGGSNVVKMDFDSNGNATMVGGGTSTSSASVSGDVFSSSHSHSGSGSSGSSGSHSHPTPGTSTNGAHSHGISVGVGSSSHDHGFSGGSHSHSIPAPSWVSLNGVAYFL